jgi:hypothetical protein
LGEVDDSEEEEDRAYIKLPSDAAFAGTVLGFAAVFSFWSDT